jgi:hypothetical protein
MFLITPLADPLGDRVDGAPFPIAHSARKARCPTAALRVKIPAPAVTIPLNWWHLTSGTNLRGRDKTCARTRRREPNLLRSALHPRPVRESSRRRMSGHNCSAVFLPFLVDKNMQRVPDRDRLRPRAAEVGTWPCFQAPAQMRIVLDRFQARRNRQAERSRLQRGSCHRQQSQPGPEREGTHSQSRRQRRE